PQLWPRVAPWTRAGRAVAHAIQVGVKRPAAVAGETTVGLPQTLQREHEVPPATAALELGGGVVLAQADMDAVAKRDAGRAPARPLDADGADRLLGRHASRLVERRSPSAGHGAILSDR